MVILTKSGWLTIDMATSKGNNAEGAKIDEIIVENGIKIIG